MSDELRYQIHLKRLNQIKQRPNKYPFYNIKIKGKNSPSPRKMKIDKLLTEIKTNKLNISLIKKGFEKKKPVDYKDDDKYIYEREVENIQKKLVNQLINKNQNLQNKVQSLRLNNYYYK